METLIIAHNFQCLCKEAEFLALASSNGKQTLAALVIEQCAIIFSASNSSDKPTCILFMLDYHCLHCEGCVGRL